MPIPRSVTFLITSLILVLSACGTTTAPAPTPAGNGPAEREVTFPTEDGLTLHGRTFGDGEAGIVLSHMFPADMTAWFDAARHMAGRGYTVLAFNFRGYPPSEGSRDLGTAPGDVLAAVAFLQRSGVEHVALVGASMGGTASLMAAAEVEVAAVVALSAPVRFRGMDVDDVVPALNMPVLLMAAQEDGPGNESLEALTGRLPEAETDVFGGDAHGTNLLLDRPESLEHIERFLLEHLPPTGG